MSVAPTGLVAILPTAELGTMIGVAEVLTQEGIACLAIGSDFADQAEFMAIYGGRISIGVLGIREPEAARHAATNGAEFLLADVPDPAIAAAVDVPCFGQAMTPSDIRSVRDGGFDGAMFYPADVLGHVMAERLADIGLIENLVPRGGIGAFAAEQWFKAGARAVCVDHALIGNAATGGSLEELRDRCGSFIRIQPRQPE